MKYDCDEETFLLLHKVPPSGTPAFDDWRKKIRQTSPEPEFLLNVLRESPTDMHYGAMLALREAGYDVWSKEYYEQEFFVFRRPGDKNWERLFPKYVDVRHST